MTFPADVKLVRVTCGTGYDFSGDPIAITLEVTPVLGGSLKRLIHAATGTFMTRDALTFKSDPGSPATFTVPSPAQAETWKDGSGEFFTNWSYSVTVTTRTASGKIQSWIQSFQPVDGQEAVDLDLVPDGQIGSPTSAPAPAVTSVNGRSGAVVIDVGEVVTPDSVAANLTVEAVDAKLPERLSESALSAAIADMSPILQTKFETFGIVADVGEEQAFWDKLASQSPRVHVETIGTSVQGRPIQMIAIGNPVPPTDPSSIDANSLLIVATQQGGEPAPREAIMQAGRNLAMSDDPDIRNYLRDHPIYLIPTLSPDGEANGTYENANGVNINRDHLALAQPETRALHEVINRIKPHLILDMHESGIQTSDFMAVAGRYLGAHPGINQITSELYVETTKAVRAIGSTATEYGGSSQEQRALHIMGQMSICPVEVFETLSTGRPIGQRVLEHVTGVNTLIEYHRVNSSKVRTAVLALRSAPPQVAYLQHSNQVTPAPTGYRMTSAQWATVQATFGFHALQTLADGTDRIVTLDQWKGWIIPNLIDTTASWPVGVGSRMSTPISDYVITDSRTPFPPVPKTYVKIFGEDVEGATPTGVTSMLSGTQTVTAVPGATNGKALGFSAAQNAVAITESLSDPLAGDSEILFRWKASPSVNGHGPSAFLRMKGDISSPSGYRGGYRHVSSPAPATGGAQLAKYTSGSAAVLGINTRIPLYESEQWYYTRFRMQADLMTLTIWKEGEETPLLDQNQIIDGSYVNGWAGVGTDGAISFFVDWIVHATGGAHAVAPN